MKVVQLAIFACLWPQITWSRSNFRTYSPNHLRSLRQVKFFVCNIHNAKLSISNYVSTYAGPPLGYSEDGCSTQSCGKGRRKFKPVTSFLLSYRQFLTVLFSNVRTYSFETSVCVQALQKFHGFGVKSHKYHNAKGLRKV